METPETERASLPASPGSAIWLIEKLWQDSMENESSAARGYSPEGYCATEAEADALIAEAGICKANGWPITRDMPFRRKERVERISPNDKTVPTEGGEKTL